MIRQDPSGDPATPTVAATRPRGRRATAHTLTLSPFFERWVSGRMAERGMTRKAVVEDLVGREVDRGAVYLGPAARAELSVHAESARQLARAMRLGQRDPERARQLQQLEDVVDAMVRLVR